MPPINTPLLLHNFFRVCLFQNYFLKYCCFRNSFFTNIAALQFFPTYTTPKIGKLTKGLPVLVVLVFAQPSYLFARTLPNMNLTNETELSATVSASSKKARYKKADLEQKQHKKPKLQLATNYQKEIEVSEYWISEKLDGVRGYWNGKQLLTRSGNVIATPKGYTQGWPNVAMDGELWIARNKFEQVSGCVRQKQPSDCWSAIKFYIFDLPEHAGNFSQRVRAMQTLVGLQHQNAHQDKYQSHIKIVKQYRLDSNEALQQRLDYDVSNGAEGLMLHHQAAYYHQGRTAKLLKLKKHHDAEAIVIAHHPGKGKYQGKLGAIEVEMPNGIRFKIGSGFSDKDRDHPPKIGAIVTYKYIGKTQRGVPRFASFLRVRPAV